VSAVVILDADFLSAFLKIERLPLLLTFYQIERFYVPSAVYRELAVTSLLPSLLAIPWIGIKDPTPARLQSVVGDEAFGVLGAGEQAAIALALDHPGSVLLSNDRQVQRLATGRGVTVINIPAFLLACKLAGVLDRAALAEITAALQTKDYYGFRRDVLKLLLD
jgi:predicted nucleic acid-binding protein